MVTEERAAPREPSPALHLISSIRQGPGGTDALADVATARTWFAAVAAGHARADLGDDVTVDTERLDALRLVRGAVDQILLGQPRASSLAVVNRYDTESAPSWDLALAADGAVVARRRVWGSGVESWLGTVAADCIELVRTGAHDRVLACATPECDEVFLAAHHRRRYCTQACAHRWRQVRYQRRHRTSWTAHDG